MLDRRQERELKPVHGLIFGLAGALATASIVALAAFAAPRPADALPAYSLTGFGKTFAASGHKVPSKGEKPAKTGASEPTPTAPVPTTTRSAPSVGGTASVFFTTSPGVSNQSATFECFNCGVFVDPR